MKKAAAVFLIILLVGADQASKYLVELYLPFHEAVEVIPYLAMYKTHNEGIAFSFLSGLDDRILVIFTLVIIAFVIWLWSKASTEKWLSQVGFALIVGGAVGNLIDRAYNGYVIDFILFHTPVWSFAIFNLADSFITVGAGAIILDELLDIRRQRGEKSPQNSD